MPISLLRRERRFYDLFDRQAENVVAAARLLRTAFDGDIAEMPVHQAAIKDLEHAGDEVTHEIIQTLHRTFITPFDREDIYALSSGLDDVLDYVDEIAETIILYGITIIPPAANSMAGLIVDAAVQVKAASGTLASNASGDEPGNTATPTSNVGRPQYRPHHAHT